MEAREKNGALLGFDRTAILSFQPAEAIAAAAQAFGQEDDITVLTFIRRPAEQKSTVDASSPILAPS